MTKIAVEIITSSGSIYTTAQFFRGQNSRANQRERRESCRIFRQRHCQNHFAFHIMTRSGSYVTLLSSRCTESFCGFQLQLSRNELELFNENGENLTKTADNAVTMIASINRFSPSIFKKINMRLNMTFN